MATTKKDRLEIKKGKKKKSLRGKRGQISIQTHLFFKYSCVCVC